MRLTWPFNLSGTSIPEAFYSEPGQPTLFVCTLLCYPVVCFAHTAVFAPHTAKAALRVRPLVWHVSSMWEGKSSGCCLVCRLAAGVLLSLSSAPWCGKVHMPAFFSQSCFRAFFSITDCCAQTLPCYRVWPHRGPLAGMLEKGFLLWVTGWTKWPFKILRFYDSTGEWGGREANMYGT